MKNYLIRYFVFSFIIAFNLSPNLTGQDTLITYVADTTVIANPERGLWTWNSNSFGTEGLPAPLTASLDKLNALHLSHGLTVCVPTYSFNAFKDVPLPQSVLDLIDQDFATARENGYKLMPHFNYCSRSAITTDASATWMVAHLKQLKPIFEKNADVLAAGMWGMYGFWSNNGVPLTAQEDATLKPTILPEKYFRQWLIILRKTECS